MLRSAPRSARLAVPLLAGLALASCSGGSSRHAAAPTTSPTAGPSATPVATPTRTVVADPTPQDPLSPKPALESPAPLGRPTCRSAALSVVDADTVSVPGGVLREVFAVRTTGPTCQLVGYPALRLLDVSGAPLAVRVDRGGHGLPAGAPHALTLSRSTSVSFELALPAGPSCRDTATVVVRLPGTTADLRTATAVQVCAAAVGVSPIERRVDSEGTTG